MMMDILEEEQTEEEILADSGSALNACPRSYAPEYPLQATVHGPRASTASGAVLPHHGRKTVRYEFEDRSAGSVTYEVLDVNKLVLSVLEKHVRLLVLHFLNQS